MCAVVGISIPPSLLSAFSSSKHRLHGKKTTTQHTDPDSAWDQAVLRRVAAALPRAPWCTAAKLFYCIINTDN